MRILGTLAILVLGLSLSFGQSGSQPASSSSGASSSPEVTRSDNRNQDNTKWGWIGVLGLAGLGGLAGRKRETTRDQDSAPNLRRVA